MAEVEAAMAVAMGEAMEGHTLALILDILTMQALMGMGTVGEAEAQVSLSLEALTTTLWVVYKQHIMQALQEEFSLAFFVAAFLLALQQLLDAAVKEEIICLISNCHLWENIMVEEAMEVIMAVDMEEDIMVVDTKGIIEDFDKNIKY